MTHQQETFAMDLQPLTPGGSGWTPDPSSRVIAAASFFMLVVALCSTAVSQEAEASPEATDLPSDADSTKPEATDLPSDADSIEPETAVEETEPTTADSPATNLPEPEPTKADEGTVTEEERGLFQLGVDQMRAQAWENAADAFRQYQDAYPDGKLWMAASELRALALYFLEKQRAPAGPDRGGRIEIVAYGTTFGIWTGVAFWVISELEESGLLLTAIGGGAGLASSLFLTTEGRITTGQAATMIAGGTWGTWNGVALGFILDMDNVKDIVTSALIMGTTGLVGFALVAPGSDPDPGDISVVSSGGVWGTFIAGMALLIADPEHIEKSEVFLTLASGSDLGLLTMGLLSPYLDISRGRSRLIDLGGLLGVLTAGGVRLAVEEDVGRRSVGISMLGGGLGGLGLAVLATEAWDLGKGSDDRLTRSQIELVNPSPFVLPHRAHNGETGVIYGVNVLQGQF